MTFHLNSEKKKKATITSSLKEGKKKKREKKKQNTNALLFCFNLFVCLFVFSEKTPLRNAGRARQSKVQLLPISVRVARDETHKKEKKKKEQPQKGVFASYL